MRRRDDAHAPDRHTLGRFDRAIAAILSLALLCACDASLCGNEVLAQQPSPDGAYVADVFERDCGATTPFVRVVSLRPSQAAFDPDDSDGWVFTIDGQPSIRTEWSAPGQLRISFSGGGFRPVRKEQWRDVAVSFGYD